MAKLFEPIYFGNLRITNRIIIAPMCQYSAQQGLVTFWHAQQWANYALSGAGLVIVEATAVQPEGRISYADLGLWNVEQQQQIQKLLQQVKTIAPTTTFAIQLAHAGRKASTDKPWLGRNQISEHDNNGWKTVAPSAIAFDPEDELPHALTVIEIKKIQDDFAASAKRAVDAGFELIELHAAHGYLLHQFLSPLANQRQDEYGGDFKHRIRMTLETFQAVKRVVPENYPIGVRLSAQDWVDDGWTLAETVELSKQLEQLGAAYIHISSAGLHIEQKIDIKAGYQVEFAAAVKQAVKIPVIAVGLITTAQQAEDILQNHQADAIAIARAALYDPRWAWHAAAELGETITTAPQYLRCQPHQLKSLFESF